MSWSLGDRDYVSNGDKGGCSSDYFKYPGKFGQSVTCPDNVSAKHEPSAVACDPQELEYS